MTEADSLAIDYHAIVGSVPILLAGVTTGELYQWCIWKSKHAKDGWMGYWDLGLPHVGMNLAIVLGSFTAWHCGVLSAIVSLCGGTPIAQLLAVSPPVGFLIVLIADVLGDQVAYAIRTRAGDLPLVGKFFKGPPIEPIPQEIP